MWMQHAQPLTMYDNFGPDTYGAAGPFFCCRDWHAPAGSPPVGVIPVMVSYHTHLTGCCRPSYSPVVADE
jgi:hypothetical protein